ncbi:unnamed protein product [Urochloa humidicola]
MELHQAISNFILDLQAIISSLIKEDVPRGEYSFQMRDDPVRPKLVDRGIPLFSVSARLLLRLPMGAFSGARWARRGGCGGAR